MKDIDLSSMISRAQVVFDIIKNEYKVFLSSEKLDLIENLDYSKFFKLMEKDNNYPIYLSGDTYYLNPNLDSIIEDIPNNSNDLYSMYLRNNKQDKIYYDLIIFMCLSLLCGELNPLKIGLIEYEIRKINQVNNLDVSLVNNYKELEIASIVREKLLDDIPYNIIFLDSDIEIFNYLTEEKGITVAKHYYEISKLMQEKFKGFDKNKFTLKGFLDYYNKINYDDVLDIIYDFINTKIR